MKNKTNASNASDVNQDIRSKANDNEGMQTNEQTSSVAPSPNPDANDPDADTHEPQHDEKAPGSNRPVLRDGFGGFEFSTVPGHVKIPLKTYLFFEERECDRDLVVAVPARVQTWMVSQSFVHGVHHLIPKFDERISGLTYNLTDQLLIDAKNRGRLSREVLLNIVKYISKFRDFIGLTALAKLDSIDESKPDYTSRFSDERVVLLPEFKKFLQLGGNSAELLDLLNTTFTPVEVNSILEMAISQVDRYLIRGVLSPAVMRFALEDQISSVSDWETLIATLTLPRSQSAIRALQDLYQYAASSRALDGLGNKITDIASGDSSLSTLIQITDMFSRFDGPVVHLKIDSVVDASLRAAGFSTSELSTPEGQYIFRKLSRLPADLDFDCTRLHVMKFYLSLVDFYTKRSASIEEAWSLHLEQQYDLSYLALTSKDADHKNLHPTTGGFLPASYKNIPYIETHPDFPTYQSLKNDEVFQHLSKLFERVFVRRIFTLATSGDYGLFMNRLRSLIDERALERSDTWDYVVDSALKAGSIYYQAFVDSCGFFKHLALERSIHYICDSETLTDFLEPLFSTSLEHDQVAVLGSDHPASIYEGANVTQSFLQFVGGDQVLEKVKPWVLSDKVSGKRETAQIYNPLTDQYDNFYIGKLQGGSFYDVPTAFPKGVHYYGLAGDLEVGRLIPEDLGSSLLADTDLGRFLFSHPRLSGLLATGYGEMFLRSGMVEFEKFFSPEDVAIRMGIPEPFAKAVWDEGLLAIGAGVRVLMTYTGPAQRFLAIPADMFPFTVYEREARFGSTIIRADYPYQAKRSYTGWLGTLPDLSVTGSDPAKSIENFFKPRNVFNK